MLYFKKAYRNIYQARPAAPIVTIARFVLCDFEDVVGFIAGLLKLSFLFGLSGFCLSLSVV